MRPRQRTARRRRSAPINTPLSPGRGNFAAKRSRGMPLHGRGKFLLNGAGATRQGPRRQVARQERLQWGAAVSPKGTHAKHVRLERATLAGRSLRREQGQGVTGSFRSETQSGGGIFRQAARRGCSAGEGAGLTARLLAAQFTRTVTVGHSRIDAGHRIGCPHRATETEGRPQDRSVPARTLIPRTRRSAPSARWRPWPRGQSGRSRRQHKRWRFPATRLSRHTAAWSSLNDAWSRDPPDSGQMTPSLWGTATRSAILQPARYPI